MLGPFRFLDLALATFARAGAATVSGWQTGLLVGVHVLRTDPLPTLRKSRVTPRA